jgi:hypothetical protein
VQVELAGAEAGQGVDVEKLVGARLFNLRDAGKSRFGLGRSVAILHCDQKGLRKEYLPL